MTYDELGRIRGIGRESAVKLVQRKRWRRTRGNDGEARICVPPDWLTLAKSPSEEASPGHSPDHSPDASPDIPRIMRTLEVTITALTVRAERAEAEADRLIATVQTERERAGRAEAERDAERTRTEAERQGREAERSRAEAADARAVELRALLDTAEAKAVERERAEAERAAWSRWRRLREALRRE